MRKLNVLKTIVDFICIMNYIAIPLLTLGVGFLMISHEPIDIPININGIEVNVIDLKTKIMLIFMMLSALILVYCIFLFRRILLSFQKAKIFEIEVIKNFYTIGFLLIIAALASGIPAFFIKIVNKKVNLEIGINPFIVLFSLGLFFMVLSEVFTIAKKQKEENELTI